MAQRGRLPQTVCPQTGPGVRGLAGQGRHLSIHWTLAATNDWASFNLSRKLGKSLTRGPKRFKGRGKLADKTQTDCHQPLYHGPFLAVSSRSGDDEPPLPSPGPRVSGFLTMHFLFWWTKLLGSRGRQEGIGKKQSAEV